MRDQRGQGWRRGCSAVCGESRVQGDPAGHPPLTAYTPPSYSQPACPSGLAPPGPGEHWERWERTRLPQPWGLLPRVLRTKERLHPGRGGGSFPLPVGPAQLRPPPGSGLLVHSRAEQPVSYAVVSQGEKSPFAKFWIPQARKEVSLLGPLSREISRGWKHPGLGRRRPRHRRLMPSA